MTGEMRTLQLQDSWRVMEFLEQSPVENLFLTSKVARFGLDRKRLGRIHAYLRDGVITALCLDGGTVFVTGNDPDALPHFVRQLGGFRRATSIVGPTFPALGLFVGLAERWRDQWGSISNVRRKQPLMLLDRPCAADGDERVMRLGRDSFESYLEASVLMYTDEIGSSPFKYGPGYETFVLSRLDEGAAYGIVEDGEVIFKADLGPSHGGQVQLQGVWIQPELRGRGLAVPALAQMLRMVQKEFPLVSLYVNDFNTAALRTYERLGFETVGSLSTVHY